MGLDRFGRALSPVANLALLLELLVERIHAGKLVGGRRSCRGRDALPSRGMMLLPGPAV